MRALGVLGGMSWESSAVYYRLLNQGVAARLGGLHSAPLRLASVDFAEIEALMRKGDWEAVACQLGDLGAGLRSAGAEGLLLATNTMHKVAPQVSARCGLPLLHIGDASGLGLRAAGCRRPGLLGTRFTMEDPFLIDHVSGRYGLEVLVPEAAQREALHRIIFDELCRGLLREASRRQLEGMMSELASRGCDAVILGCTEIALLTPPDAGPWPLPLFDTTALHAAAAVSWMLEETA